MLFSDEIINKMDLKLQKAHDWAFAIEELTGIELTWKEILDIKLNYTSGDIPIQYITQTILTDFFGINYQHLSAPKVSAYEVPGGKQVTIKLAGLDLLGTPEFKAYCREHVTEWRAERDLI